jgi:hypothetical protein
MNGKVAMNSRREIRAASVCSGTGTARGNGSFLNAFAPRIWKTDKYKSAVATANYVLGAKCLAEESQIACTPLLF